MCSSPSTDGLYEKKNDDNAFKGPLTKFADGVRQSVLGDSATKFFQVQVPTGSCPQWSGSFSVMGGTFVVDMVPVFCSDTSDKVMVIIGGVLMVVAAFGAFKWAIL